MSFLAYQEMPCVEPQKPSFGLSSLQYLSFTHGDPTAYPPPPTSPPKIRMRSTVDRYQLSSSSPPLLDVMEIICQSSLRQQSIPASTNIIFRFLRPSLSRISLTATAKAVPSPRGDSPVCDGVQNGRPALRSFRLRGYPVMHSPGFAIFYEKPCLPTVLPIGKRQKEDASVCGSECAGSTVASSCALHMSPRSPFFQFTKTHSKPKPVWSSRNHWDEAALKEAVRTVMESQWSKGQLLDTI
eukprot:GHVQ01032928.1.p2 GENE.GHVQ01032928.1~~GHVQ01032928.1.p2  ORF type:complete len:241 (-),score=23.83 GHVQ01032928.1:1960-2682(-)